MEVAANGTRLWFDVEGASFVPDGREMRARPTVVLLHGGPGGYDHSYFKPAFTALASRAQVVYLDLRDHGRSARHDPRDWTFEVCADDVCAFCEAVGITDPIVVGHSMGGFVAMLYAARHPGHARALVLQSTMARWDLERLVCGFGRVAGEEVAELARRSYDGSEVTDEEWARVYATFGPQVPSDEQRARMTKNPDVGPRGMALMRELDVTGQLDRIDCPTLVCVGDLDPVTPVEASREMVDGLRPNLGCLVVIDHAGHFPWLDAPATYWRELIGFLDIVTETSD